MAETVEDILRENARRREQRTFNPVTGEGSVGERERFALEGMPMAVQWLPVGMMGEPMVRRMREAGSLQKYVEGLGEEYTEEAREQAVAAFVRLRYRYDFAFWCATVVYIKNKDGGKDVLFRLNRPQRRLVGILEGMRLAGKPIRLIILKARQWGGSTCVQLYMAWLQLVMETGLNSLIIAHLSSATERIKAMFDKMINAYPVGLLHRMGDVYAANEQKMVGVGRSGNIYRVPQRNCDINLGTAESSESSRSGAYNLVHLSEIGLWKETEKSDPEQIVRSATTGVLYRPNTMIVYESTPNGDNFFHREYLAAKGGESQFGAMFVPWHEIEQYELGFEEGGEEEFARRLVEGRDSREVESVRRETGAYLWRLWERGATLEGIHWYEQERTKFSSHGGMASEYPSDDIEAFTYSGRMVFDSEEVEQLRRGCRPPRWRGEIYGRMDEGEGALEGVHWKEEPEGRLKIWHDVERIKEVEIIDRYLVVVDVCKGHTEKADYADILVIDRMGMMDGEPPVVAAEWHGHIEMDRLAWKAAQVAAYYNNALLVIESNTLETNNTKGEAEYILTLIGNVYDNLYTRRQSAADVTEGRPRKYGFHTNTVTKKAVIYDLKVALRGRLYVEREAEALNEYLTYVETEKGVYEAKKGYHDDRLMTRAIGLFICFKEMEVPRAVNRAAAERGRMSRVVVSEATIG